MMVMVRADLVHQCTALARGDAPVHRKAAMKALLEQYLSERALDARTDLNRVATMAYAVVARVKGDFTGRETPASVLAPFRGWRKTLPKDQQEIIRRLAADVSALARAALARSEGVNDLEGLVFEIARPFPHRKAMREALSPSKPRIVNRDSVKAASMALNKLAHDEIVAVIKNIPASILDEALAARREAEAAAAAAAAAITARKQKEVADEIAALEAALATARARASA